MKQTVLILFAFISWSADHSYAQCIDAFPHTEDFEGGQAGWTSGIYSGSENTWAFGTPNKDMIQGACGGSNAWTTGGLGSGTYAPGEHSYVQSPCYDFSALENPMISACIWIETEGGYDGVVLQASVDGGDWTDVGGVGSTTSCEGAENWYNDASVNYLEGGTTGNGWNGNNLTLSGSGCTDPGGGSGGWITATHCLAGEGSSNVQLRFLFGAGTTCESDGFAFDNVTVYSGSGFGDVVPDFNITGCTKSGSRRGVNFDDTSTGDACFDNYEWDFGDGNTESGNASPGDADTGNGYMATGTYTPCITYSNNSCYQQTYCCDIEITDGSGNNCSVTTSNCGLVSPMFSESLTIMGRVLAQSNEIIVHVAEYTPESILIVEKSNDNINYSPLKSAQINSQNLRFYDDTPKAKTYYRAKVIDNINEETSKSIALTNHGLNSSFTINNIHPNPAKDVFSFDVSILQRGQTISYSLYSVLGELIEQASINETQSISINTEHYQAGIYQLIFVTETEKQTYKIIVQK